MKKIKTYILGTLFIGLFAFNTSFLTNNLNKNLTLEDLFSLNIAEAEINVPPGPNVGKTCFREFRCIGGLLGDRSCRTVDCNYIFGFEGIGAKDKCV